MSTSDAMFKPVELPTACDQCGVRSYVDCVPKDCECDDCNDAIDRKPTRDFSCGRGFEISTGRAYSHCDPADASRPLKARSCECSERVSPYFAPVVVVVLIVLIWSNEIASAIKTLVGAFR